MATPSSDLFALGAARQIGRWLERAWLDGTDAVARREVMLGEADRLEAETLGRFAQVAEKQRSELIG